MPDVEALIERKIGDVRTDAVDFSFGELISLFSNEEFVIAPEFQRLFRWSEKQRSRLVESVLLELPIPQLFLMEREDGVIELVDGLQRTSSMIQFIQSDVLGLEPLALSGCDLIPELDGIKFTDLTLAMRLRVKRAKVRAIVIRRQSTSMLRYEMFKRLNTGGSELSQQEIRNCTARIAGETGTRFYEFLQRCAQTESFKTCTATLPEEEREKRGDEELVLRFFALKNAQDKFKGSVVDWLDTYMESIIIGGDPIDYGEEQAEFASLFDYLAMLMGEAAFVRFRDNEPIGGLAPAYFEAVSLGTYRVLTQMQALPSERVKAKMIETLQSGAFKAHVGSGSNSITKFRGRTDSIETALRTLIG